ncbi:MAG TPA: hypothetical protein VL727_23135 [Puia sp.]|jgi:hypothetical protein|nr:hypothetical protein [Puia sp.]
MFLYTKFSIGHADHFNPGHYGFVADDLAAMMEQIKHLPHEFVAEIVVSFLKNHCIRCEWIAANPELARLVSSKSVRSDKIESLFESCQKNSVFSQELETYLKGRLTPGMM